MTNKISVQPLGHYVAVELMEVKNVSAGGIVLGDTKREKEGICFGVITGFGPTAFVGVHGCDPQAYPTNDPRYKMLPHQIWGVDIGDRIEFRRFEGKLTELGKHVGLMRYIPDTTIIGKVTGEFEVTKADF